MQFIGQVLSAEEQERIHRQSLRIIAEVGVRFHGDKALPLLARSGAQIDWEQKIARLPEELVIQALATAPKAFTLGARNPKYRFELPGSLTRYCIDGTSAFAIDFESGERRYGRQKDIELSLRVFQQTELGYMAWAPTCASDKPAPSRALHEFFTMIRFSSKHGQHELHTPAQAPYLAEGLIAVLGSEQTVRDSLDYSLIYCPVAPLSHDGPMLDAYLELGALNLPITVMPMPVNGTTGPASLYSNVCVANAEALSALVVFQLAHPGRPMIYASATGSVDFTTGGYLAGIPEMSLQSAALVTMGKYYGLPTTAAGCTSDAKQPGAEAVLEKFITTLPSVLTGCDIIVGYGEIESDQALYLEQILVDDEIARSCRRLYEGLDTSPAKDFYEDIARIGPSGHFLKARSTRSAPRSGEFLFPNLIYRGAYESWLNLGRPDLYTKAREKVHEIIENPVSDALSDSIIGALDDILSKADKELSA